jgi:hypothetical protein
VSKDVEPLLEITADRTRNLVEMPFGVRSWSSKSYVFENQEILGGDIHDHLPPNSHRKQPRAFPDMLGVDQDERVCIIELKNTYG